MPTHCFDTKPAIAIRGISELRAPHDILLPSHTCLIHLLNMHGHNLRDVTELYASHYTLDGTWISLG